MSDEPNSRLVSRVSAAVLWVLAEGHPIGLVATPFLQELDRAVGRAVVDDHQLLVALDGTHPCQHLDDCGPFVVNGNDDGKWQRLAAWQIWKRKTR